MAFMLLYQCRCYIYWLAIALSHCLCIPVLLGTESLNSMKTGWLSSSKPLPTLMAIQLNMRIRRQLKIVCRTLYLPLCCLALVLLIQTLRWLQNKQETQISDEDGIVLEEKKILYPFAIIFVCFYWYSFLWEIKCSVMVGSVTGISQFNVAQNFLCTWAKLR